MKVQLFFYALCLAVLSACETETYVTYEIQNQASTMIYVSGSDKIHSSPIQDSAAPNESIELLIWSKRGKQTDTFDQVTAFGDDLFITRAISDTCTKDYRMISNWKADIVDNGATATHVYTLIIQDSDF